MNKRIFGKTGITIPEMGMGCWAVGGVGYGPVSEKDALQALEAAWDGGVRLFDTADTYGEGVSERRVGSFLKTKKRDEYFLATKAGWDFYHGGHRKNFDSEYLRFACNQSLKRLEMEYVDLYQLHNPSIEVLKLGEAFEALLNLKKDGLIRFIGISLHTVSEALWVLENLPVDSIQVIYNILDQRMRHEVFPLALEKGVAVIAREPLANGLLSGKYDDKSIFDKQDHRRRFSQEKLKADFEKAQKIKSILGDTPLVQSALKFVLSESAVSCVIPGVKNKVQAEVSFEKSASFILSADLVRSFQKLFALDPLFQTHLLPSK